MELNLKELLGISCLRGEKILQIWGVSVQKR